MLDPWNPHTHEMRTIESIVVSTACSPANFETPYTDRGFGVSLSTYAVALVPSKTVEQHRLFLVAFACINGGPRSSMNDHVGALACDRQLHCSGIGDVEFGTGQPGYLMTASLRYVNQFAPQLSASALSGYHQQRLSRYQATVASSASSSEL